MALVTFVGGISLGFILGFVIMALLAIRGSRFQSEEAKMVKSYPACANTPMRTFSPALMARPQVSGAWFTPWRGGGPRQGLRADS
jgi:hypothetical protein